MLQLALTDKARKYWSRGYGINSTSVLLQLPYFSIVTGLLHDPMHLLFEGVTNLETKHLLKYVVLEKQYLSLSRFSAAMKELYDLLPVRCRPSNVDLSQLQSDDKLKQTAYHMWMMSHLIPVAIGKFIPEEDEKWLNYIRLLQIQQMCTSPIATPSTVRSLEIVIARHNKYFQEIYPQLSYIQKLHYIVHLPAQIRMSPNQWHQNINCGCAPYSTTTLVATQVIS